MLVPRIRLAALGDIGDLGPQIGDLRCQGRGIPLKILAPDIDAGLENRHARYLPPKRGSVTRTIAVPRPLTPACFAGRRSPRKRGEGRIVGGTCGFSPRPTKWGEGCRGHRPRQG